MVAGYSTTPSKKPVVGLLTPPPSPEMYSTTTTSNNSRHDSAARSLFAPQLMCPPTPPYSSSAPRQNQNGCSVGSTSCSHDKAYHQPQQCRCRRGLNILCTRCKTFCYQHC
ncbi:hypothetical protein RhiJN_00587 [Ceratobasidium sp. AG-Ba]|nr:hypothetical protein RhiJN_00587 [Ceratobasidium sp. AG-Ba]QRW01613.1 hypothetical protein RhiLY_00610 [Ceratobasidium sp. AG-Ba]